MTEETKFERKTWVPTDTHPNSADLNRIEGGIESAHGRISILEQVVADNESAQSAVNSQALEVTFPLEAIAEIVKQIPKLEANAKVADVVLAFNTLHDALTGAIEEDQSGEG